MADRLIENMHISVPLTATSLSNTNTTGQYVPTANVSRLLAVLFGGAAAATKTWKLELLEATDAGGTGAAAISGATATGTANTLVKKATIATGSIANTDIVTVNGVAFTKAAATSGASFADADDLATAIGTYCVGLSATNSTGTVTVVAADGYAITVSKTEVAGTITLATVESVTVVEVYNEAFDVTTTHVAPKVSVTGAGYYGVVFFAEMKSLPDGQGNFSAVYPS
jgi:hypothetical protein